jgi:hypothetical protein
LIIVSNIFILLMYLFLFFVDYCTFQDTFVESGGVLTLCALLHSRSSRAMQEAAGAIYTIVADSEENKQKVAADRG